MLMEKWGAVGHGCDQVMHLFGGTVRVPLCTYVNLPDFLAFDRSIGVVQDPLSAMLGTWYGYATPRFGSVTASPCLQFMATSNLAIATGRLDNRISECGEERSEEEDNSIDEDADA